jgi:hypothetical protein
LPAEPAPPAGSGPREGTATGDANGASPGATAATAAPEDARSGSQARA